MLAPSSSVLRHIICPLGGGAICIVLGEHKGHKFSLLALFLRSTVSYIGNLAHWRLRTMNSFWAYTPSSVEFLEDAFEHFYTKARGTNWAESTKLSITLISWISHMLHPDQCHSINPRAMFWYESNPPTTSGETRSRICWATLLRNSCLRGSGFITTRLSANH